MSKEEVILKTKNFLKEKFSSENTGHDWYHTYRVWKLSRSIAGKEPDTNLFLTELAALLHDIADWKFHTGNEEAGPKAAREWLEKLGVENPIIKQVEEIVRNVSFKGAKVLTHLKTKEGQIVSDADKLDAMGAIGIGRAFAYGGAKNRPMHDPNIKSKHHHTFEDYKNSKSSTINHFYEKLLLLKDRMYTNTAKKIAKHRHKILEDFLKEFHKEWEVKL